MQTILVELMNDKALKLLQELESLDLIRLLPEKPSQGKLSEKFSGKLDHKIANKMQETIAKSREEWERGI